MDIDTAEVAIEAPVEITGATIAGAGAGAGADASGIDEIVVRGTYEPPLVTSATRTPTLLVDVPQSVSVVSQQQIEDQALRSIADVLRFTPGAVAAQGEGHRDQVIIRGQNSTANFFIDGLRDDVQYFRPLYNLERVEVLKGANALAFGRGAGGGVINRVTKTPVVGTAFTAAEASVDTFGSAVVSADTNVGLGEAGALRVNAFYEHLENHRDVYEGDRYAVNPTLAFEPGDATRVDLSYEYVFDDRVVDRGVPSTPEGGPLRGFRDAFFGDPDANVTELEAHILRGTVSHRASDAVTINAAVQYADYNKAYRNIYPAGLGEDDQVTLDGYFDRTDRENLLGRVEAVAEAMTGGVGHTILFGIEGADQATANDRRDTLFAASDDDRIDVPLADPITVPAFGFPEFGRDRSSDVQAVSVYAQDQLDFGPVQLVAGLRYDRFEIDVTDRAAIADGEDGRLRRADEEFSPRLGLVYKPVPEASIYASYAKSFLPRSGDQFLTLSLSSEALGPETFETYEVGAKWDVRPGLALTAALFEIERDAGTTVDPDDPERTILIGTSTRGGEVQLSGRVNDRLVLNAGYSYLDAEEDGRVVDGADADRPLAQVPEHQLSGWARFEATDRLGFGLGVTHQSSQLTSLSGEVRLPSFTRVDAAAYYALSNGVQLQLNVENVTDETYFPAAHNDDNITTGAPLNARATLRAAF